MENKKKITIKSAIACLVLLVILIGASFAYFGMFTVNLENKVAVNIYANDIGNTSFIATSANLNVIVPKSGMFKGNTGLAAENTATLTVNLTGAPNVITTCTYDVVYEYDLSSEIYGSTVNVTSGATKEITMQVKSPSGTNSYVNETNFAYDSSWTPKTSTVGAKKILVRGATIKSSGTSTIQDINITGRYYNLNLDQSQLVDKSFTGTIYVENNNCTVKELEPTLYNAIAKRYNNGDEQVKLYDGTKYGDTTTYANNIYYFDVYTTNNNVFFGGFCWQMVRTTDTGGVKLIYNGIQKYVSDDYTLLSQSEYSNLNNDASYPYTYDETNKTWTSTNTGTNSSTISFSAPSNGNYVINYDLSMYNYINYINVEIFKDDVSQGKYTGTTTGQIGFEDLTTSNVIKVVFTRTESWTSGSRNNVIFSFGKANSIIKSCNNTQTDAEIGKSAFNSSSANSLVYAGYMYNKNKIYMRLNKSMSSLSNVIFGNSFTYANGNYTLKDTITVSTWSNEYENINNNHYTFFNESTSQSKIYYVYYTTSSEAYYIELSNGKSVEDALNDMLYGDNVNVDNSTIKDTIDTWYTNNMTSYTDKLEDTIFCNDRSLSNKGGWEPNGGNTSTELEFKNEHFNYSLACENKNDRFTVNTDIGNGALTYPVGLLSSAEMYSFSNGQKVWYGTPVVYAHINSEDVDTVIGRGSGDSNGAVFELAISSSCGVRPAISLKPDTIPTKGDGTYTNPFVIN